MKQTLKDNKISISIVKSLEEGGAGAQCKENREFQVEGLS